MLLAHLNTATNTPILGRSPRVDGGRTCWTCTFHPSEIHCVPAPLPLWTAKLRFVSKLQLCHFNLTSSEDRLLNIPRERNGRFTNPSLGFATKLKVESRGVRNSLTSTGHPTNQAQLPVPNCSIGRLRVLGFWLLHCGCMLSGTPKSLTRR